MPHLVLRGITIEAAKEMSRSLVEELAGICECGTDNFTLELAQSVFVFDGAEIPAFPLIEVKWFERGVEVRDRFAGAVTRHVKEAGAQEVEVIFYPLSEEQYYIDGIRCSE
ncbi:DUF1904 family protein [Ectobacillus ponti]|uniref:DUF1904 domain-containing protein n=1 Tax=Ectobacillus ponti TaxID=2961894 RepID=A0AA41X657_9BACI|nr:DUF1904 family protein [Ectobacillus ponti]MCP8969659.1 DUF1904 domain-containing protein [Ectobacillus ponti]